MLRQHLKDFSKKRPTAVLNEAVQQFQRDGERRGEDLIAFLNEFANSEEYEQYTARKRSLRRRNASTQYCLDDLKTGESEVEDKYPLTTQSRKMIAFRRYLDKYTRNKNNKEVVEKQERGIKIVKEKIDEYKNLYESTKDKMYQTRERRENKVLEEFCDNLNIDVSTLSLKAKNKMRDKVVCYQKVKNSRNLKVKRNVMDIVRKLIDEYRRKKQIDKALNKTYLYRVSKREKVLKNMEIVGKKLVLKPRDEGKKEEEPEKVEEEEQPPPIEEEEPITKKRKGKKEKTGKSKGGKEKGKKAKKEKKVKVKKPKKEKKARKDKKQKTNELIIPPIPMCNLREKLGPENYEELLKVLTDFDNLEDMLEDQHMLTMKRTEEENLYDNENFSHHPAAIVFRDFDCGKIYKKKLKILNTSMQYQKLRILEMTFTNPYDAVFFKIEPLLGIRKLARGCYLQLTVIFLPEDNTKQIDGKIVFVSYDRYSTRYQKFFIRVQCVPSYTDLHVHPRLIKFGKIPVWKAYNVNYKTIKLKNDGNKPCTIIINKAPDPLRLDAVDDTGKAAKGRNKDREYVSGLVGQCLENALSYFGFEHYIVRIQGLEEVRLDVTFRNIDHVGNYLEKYYLEIYELCQDDTVDCSGCQKLIASAETTSYFIGISSDVLDFGVCVLNSVYQLSCDILNNSPITQSVSIKFPAHTTDYIKSDVPHLYIPPESRRTVWFKFLPRKSTLDVPTYFDRETSILEFPVYFCVVSKAHPDMPPIKATVFAVLTQQKCLTVVPAKRKYYEGSSATLNLGECSTFETVYADVELTNNTLAPQVYGFVNVPQCLTIMPNYGFGEVMPEERKNLRIYFSPDSTDGTDGFEMGGNQPAIVAYFRIHLETLSFLGQRKTEINIKRFKRTVDRMIKEMTTKREESLIGDMEIFAYYVRVSLFQRENASEEGSFGSRDTLEEPPDEADGGERPCSTQLWLKARILTPLYEFSHQYVRFPRTACGSYSIVQIELRAANADYFFKKSKPRFNYKATFRIQGGGEEIAIEPSCGFLKKGEVQKITLIAKPTVPEKIVTSIAKNFKYLEIFELKRREYEQMKEEALKKKSKKGKKKKTETKKKDKPSKRRKSTRREDAQPTREETEEPEIVVSEKELALDYLDLYPAEMYHWRSLQPYSIDAQFACTITYEGENMGRKSETLRLNATCPVVRPDFATNLKMQRIDFGTVVIGLEKSEPVTIQNIHHEVIAPRFSPLSPVGPFSLPYMKGYRVPPEHFFEVPIIFAPNQDGTVEEYFEISSGATTLPLILEGTGVTPDIEIVPPFLVFRLSTKRNALAQCLIEIRNNNEVDQTITIEKLFELEGVMKEPARGGENKEETVKKEATKKTKAKAEKGAKGKKGKPQKYSDELTDVERASLADFRKKDGKKGEFCYEAVNMEGNDFVLAPESAQIIKFCFGTPELLAARKEENMRKLRGEKKPKGRKGKEDKAAKKDKKSVVSKTSGKSKEETAPGPPEEQIYHVAKYNVMLNKTFLKDFILISTFIK